MNTEHTVRTKKLSEQSVSPLKWWREKYAMTQSEVAEHIGTTQITISRWENKVTTPGPHYRKKLAELFGASMAELGFVTENNEAHHARRVSSSSALDSQDVSPPPLYHVPYRRNPFFTGREEVLTHLHTNFVRDRSDSATSIQAICGMGGIGKTQVAIEYVYHYGHEYQAIFWVTVSTPDALGADCVILTSLLGLPEQQEQNQEIVVRAVKRWLSTTTLRWLLILDNVSDLKWIAEFLPTQSTGNVLLTTQLQALGTVAAHALEIEKMGYDEAILFLLRRAKVIAPEASLEQVPEESKRLATEIVALMDGLPLALDQAGAYIEEKCCGLSQYLGLYAIRRKELLAQRGKLPTTHPEPVTTTWSLSFQEVKQQSSAAADLLYLLAFLGPEPIPEELLPAGAEELGPMLGIAARDPLQIDAILELILRYSLIKRIPATESFSVHRLVQIVLKEAIEPDSRSTWAKRALLVLNSAFPKAEPHTWKTCRRYLPHVLVCAESSEEYGLAMPEAARLFNEAASYLMAHSSYTKAESLLQKALAIRQRILGDQNPDTARTLNDLGVLYFYQGRYQEAGRSLQEALKIRSRVLGELHSNVAETLDNLASLNRTLGAYSESEQFYLRAQHILENVPDVDVARIAHCYFGLARVYYRQGKFDRAEMLCIRAMTIQEQQFGENHPTLASTLSILAKIYHGQQKLDRAKETNLRALQMRENISGPNHSQIATIINSLVEIYHIEGKYQEAEALIERAFQIHKETFGSEHPSMAYSLSNKAETLFLQGNYTQAESLYKKACMIRELRLGFEHPHTASTYADLGRFYAAVERYEEAEAYFRKALYVRGLFFDHNHPLYKTTVEQHTAVLKMLEQARPTDT